MNIPVCMQLENIVFFEEGQVWRLGRRGTSVSKVLAWQISGLELSSYDSEKQTKETTKQTNKKHAW